MPANVPKPSAGLAQAMDRRDPEAGTYWRARADVPARERTETTQDRWGSEVKLRHRKVLERAPVPAGTLLLLRSTHKVDGRVHTLVTAPSPAVRGDAARTWLIDDFEAFLEPVDEAEAQAERAGQVDATLGRIQGLRGEMAAIAAGVAETRDAIAAPDAALSRSATPSVLGQARERAQAVATAIEEKTQSIQALNQRLMAETQDLVALQTEQASAALASVQDALELAQAAQRASETLDLFGGAKVELIKVLDGEGAPAGTPVTLYQNRLYFDEELAVHLHQGGFDSSNFGELPELFARHPALVERIAGAPRAVVLLRIRRDAKIHFKGAGIERMFDELSLMERDREQFLLLRDGGRVSLVFAETALQEAERLFPTLDEMDRPFRGAGGGEEITVKDARFTQALGAFERQALVYKRLLVLLWGLEFGEERPLGHVEADGRPGNWYDPAWQAEHVTFVPDDATRSLPDARPAIQDYMEANAALLQPGARVIVDWRRAIDPDTAPSIATYEEGSYGERVRVSHRPEETFSQHVVKAHEEGLVVEVPVRRTAIGRGRASFKAKVDLTMAPPNSFLVLDGIEDEDLAHYCESRISRRHYLDYLELFRETRRALRETFAEVRAVDARVASDLAGQLRGQDPGTVRRAVREAHRMWRAANDGKLPSPRQEREIRDAAFLVLTGTPAPEAIPDIAGIVGMGAEDILLAGIDGRARLVVVAPGPADPLVRPDTWVERRTFAMDAKGGWKPASAKVATLPRPRDPSFAERLRSPRVESFVKGSALPRGIRSREDTQAVLEALAGVSPATLRARHVDAPRPGALLDEWYEQAYEWTYRKRPPGYDRGTVITPDFVTVFGAVLTFDGGHRRRGHPILTYLGITSDFVARAIHADPAQSARFHEAVGEEHRGLAARLWRNPSTRASAARGRADGLARAAAEGRPAHDMRLCGIGADEVVPPARLRDEGPHLTLSHVGLVSSRREPSLPDEKDREWFADFFKYGRAGSRRGTDAPPAEARLVVRADTWAWLGEQTGWTLPAGTELHLLEPGA